MRSYFSFWLFYLSFFILLVIKHLLYLWSTSGPRGSVQVLFWVPGRQSPALKGLIVQWLQSWDSSPRPLTLSPLTYHISWIWLPYLWKKNLDLSKISNYLMEKSFISKQLFVTQSIYHEKSVPKFWGREHYLGPLKTNKLLFLLRERNLKALIIMP